MVATDHLLEVTGSRSIRVTYLKGGRDGSLFPADLRTYVRNVWPRRSSLAWQQMWRGACF